MCMAIGVGEMMLMARRVESYTLRAFEPFAVATLTYLAVSLTVSLLINVYNAKVLRTTSKGV